jgi:hypothetical protein
MLPQEHAMDDTVPSVRDLRRAWKPLKEGPASDDAHEPIRVRLHRCFSWLQAAESLEHDDEHADLRLINQWIALNSLYGRWDGERGEPRPDFETLMAFVERLLAADHDGILHELVVRKRKLIEAIYKDEYVSKFFWSAPSLQRAKQSQKAYYDARTWYLEGNDRMILDRLLERIYFVRCQLVHGAATWGGKLNRKSLRRCTEMLQLLMPAFARVITDHAWEGDWGDLCYPPSV